MMKNILLKLSFLFLVTLLTAASDVYAQSDMERLFLKDLDRRIDRADRAKCRLWFKYYLDRLHPMASSIDKSVNDILSTTAPNSPERKRKIDGVNEVIEKIKDSLYVEVKEFERQQEKREGKEYWEGSARVTALTHQVIYSALLTEFLVGDRGQSKERYRRKLEDITCE